VSSCGQFGSYSEKGDSLGCWMWVLVKTQREGDQPLQVKINGKFDRRGGTLKLKPGRVDRKEMESVLGAGPGAFFLKASIACETRRIQPSKGSRR